VLTGNVAQEGEADFKPKQKEHPVFAQVGYLGIFRFFCPWVKNLL